MRYGPTDMLQGTTSCHLAEPWKVQMTDHFASHSRCDVSSYFGRCLIGFLEDIMSCLSHMSCLSWMSRLKKTNDGMTPEIHSI